MEVFLGFVTFFGDAPKPLLKEKAYADMFTSDGLAPMAKLTLIGLKRTCDPS